MESSLFLFCFFFLFPLKQQRKNEHTTRDDGQGSTHVLGFRRTCCYGNAGCAAPEVRRQHARSTQSHGYSMASSGRCRRARQSGAWAPQLSTRGPPFTRVLPPPPRGEGRGPGGRLRCLASCSANRKPTLGLGQYWHSPSPTSPCSRTAWNVLYLTSSCRFSPPFFLPYI